MKRYHVTVGARTTAGGTVRTGHGLVEIDGKLLSVEGDQVYCPACNSTGVIECTWPRLDQLLMDKLPALDGDLCRCKCNPPPRLIANQDISWQELDEPARPGTSAHPAALVGGLAALAARRPQPEPSFAEEEEEEEELTGITLRIGLFFDGTGNNQVNSALTAQCRRSDRDAYDEQTLDSIVEHCGQYGYKDPDASGVFRTTPNDSYGNAESNVAVLFGLYQDNSTVQLMADATLGYVKAYVEGIGTTSGSEDSTITQGSGIGASGVVSRVRQSPEVIRLALQRFTRVNPGTHVRTVEFDIFGFSRGAAAARHFANELLKPNGGVLAGLLKAGEYGLVPNFNWKRDTAINFIGLFDTVAAIVDPARGDFSPANPLNPGVNLYLPANCARKVVQLSARDERRWNFALNSVAPQHQEIELPGAHSDIGGGYPPQMEEHLLLGKPQQVVPTRERPFEHQPAWWAVKEELWNWESKGLPGKGRMEAARWPAPRPPRGSAPEEERWLAAVSIRRTVYGDLSRVALRVMHELALQHEVPFKGVPDASQFSIPADLQFVAAKILGDARGGANSLTREDNRLLFSRYIHLSAHWTPTKGLLISKPAPNGRLVFNNKPQEGYPE